MRRLAEAKINELCIGVNRDLRISEGFSADSPLPCSMKDVSFTEFLTTASDQEVFDLLVKLLRPF